MKKDEREGGREIGNKKANFCRKEGIKNVENI